MGNNDNVEKAKEIQEIKTEFKGLEKRVTTVEIETRKNQESINSVQMAQAELKTSITSLTEKIGHLESRLFNYLDNLRKDGKSEQGDWIDLIKWIIGATIVLALGYIFGKGGF